MTGLKDDPELQGAGRAYRRLYMQYEAEIVATNAAGNLLRPNHPTLLAWQHYQNLIKQRRNDGRWPKLVDQQTLRSEMD